VTRARLLRRDVRAAAGQALHRSDHVVVSIVEHDVGPHLLGKAQPSLVSIHPDDEGGAHELDAGGRAKTDRSLCEHDDGVADANAPRLRSRDARRCDVSEQDDLFIGQPRGNLGQVGLCARDEQVFGLSPLHGVAEPPAAEGLMPMAMTTL
jgi:hypothetical protein